MKILVVGPTFPFRGGIAHYTTLLSQTLSEHHDVTLLSFTRQYPQFLFPGKTDRDTSETPIRFGNTIHMIDSMNPLTWFRAVRLIQELNPDQIIVPWWASFWAPIFWTILRSVKRKTTSKIVFICHNAVDHESHPFAKAASRAVLTKADHLITHSKEVTRDLEVILGRGIGITTAFLPTFEQVGVKKYSREDARHDLKLSGDVLLFFGFVRDYKGLHVLLEALRIVLRKKQVTLLVVGEFWKGKKQYLGEIESLGISEHVQIIDRYVPNEEIGKYFSASDLVVQPYLSASGSAICQLAYGFDRPVIATRVGSLSEVIEDGVNGRLVTPGDRTGLAAAILESIEPEVKQRFSENAVKTKDKFSWEKMARIITGDPNGEKDR